MVVVAELFLTLSRRPKFDAFTSAAVSAVPQRSVEVPYVIVWSDVVQLALPAWSVPTAAPALSRKTSSSVSSPLETGAKAATTWALRLIPDCVQPSVVEPAAATGFVLMPLDWLPFESCVQRPVWPELGARLPTATPLPKTSTTHEFAARVVTLVEVAPEVLELELKASGAACFTL